MEVVLIKHGVFEESAWSALPTHPDAAGTG